MFQYIVNNHWTIAYRDNSKTKSFQVLKNPSWAWAADPFLVRYKGDVYLFAELFLYKSERKGVIGFCKYVNGKFTDWIITMDKKWHLSYPNVFVIDDELYMCPESYQREEIGIYKLISFPDRWEKIFTLKSNCACVDTTFLNNEDKTYMITYQLRSDQNEKEYLEIYEINIDTLELKKGNCISENISMIRPGGKFIYENNRIIRISQNCENEYGEGLIFNQIETIFPIYKEHIISKKYPSDYMGYRGKKYKGIHTYNKLDELEVIDLKFKKKSIVEHIARKRVRKVFTNKYK